MGWSKKRWVLTSIGAVLLVLLCLSLCVVWLNARAARTEALLIAIEQDDEAGVKASIANGADVEAWDTFLDGSPSLYWAANKGKLPMVKLLVESGAKVNSQDHCGRTPLMPAAGKNDLDVVKFLAPKSDLSLRDQMGWTALDYARHFRAVDVIGVLDPVLAAQGRNPAAAREALTAALARASSESKNVFLLFSSPKDGPSRVFDNYHSVPEVKRVLEKHYVLVNISVVYMLDGAKMLDAYGPQGVPFWVILDASGKTLADSDHNGVNIGYPSGAEGSDHYAKALRKTSPTMSEEEVHLLTNHAEQAAVPKCRP